MAINQKDIKMLWGRAGNRCSKCYCKVIADSNSGGKYVIGEQAHIVGEKETAARGKSNLDLKERNSYHNLILLCPTCHTIIDSDENEFTIEKLHYMKSLHEMKIEESVSIIQDSRENAEDIAYSHLVDMVVDLCCFESWEYWVTNITSTKPSIMMDVSSKLEEFTNKVFKMIMPSKYKELNDATKTLYLTINDLIREFHKHSKSNYVDKCYTCDKFYKADGRFNPNYHEDLEKYKEWERSVTLLAFEVTKSANWFADVVRRDINPLFFLTYGKFSLMLGPDYDLNWITYIPEYSETEKVNLPNDYSKDAILTKL